MREPSIDPERLAALLDGRLDEAERARLLAEIGDSPDALDLLADAAAVLRELEQEEAAGLAGETPGDAGPQLVGEAAMPPVPPGPLATAPVPPAMRVPAPTPPPSRPPADDTAPRAVVGEIRPRAAQDAPPAGAPVVALHQGRRPALRRWAALAAAAVVLVAAGTWYYQSRQPAGGPAGGRLADPAALIALVEAPAPPGGDALGDVPWSVTRGAGDALTPRARAVRFGARAAELEMAAQAGARDTARVRTLAGEAARLVGEVGGSGPAVAIYQRVRDAAAGGAPADSVAAWAEQAWAAGAGVLGEDASAARLGAWLATARVAAARRDAAFLRAPASRAAAAALTARADLDAATREAAGRVRAAVQNGAAPEWEALGHDVDALLAALGS